MRQAADRQPPDDDDVVDLTEHQPDETDALDSEGEGLSNTLTRVSTASTPIGPGAAPDDGPAADDIVDHDTLDHDTLIVDLDDEGTDGLGDELDAEFEAEAAEMAPLVELPDRPSFTADATNAVGDHGPTVVAHEAPDGAQELLVRVRGRGRVPARKVRRVIRRVDALSVLKLAFAFNVCLFAMFLVAALLLWSAAIGSGSTDNIESFIVDVGFEDFHLVGADLFRGFAVFGGALVVAGTVFALLMALLFNLISDIVGGIRLTVIEPLVGPAEADTPDDTEGADPH